jgi:hypothetical protein
MARAASIAATVSRFSSNMCLALPVGPLIERGALELRQPVRADARFVDYGLDFFGRGSLATKRLPHHNSTSHSSTSRSARFAAEWSSSDSKLFRKSPSSPTVYARYSGKAFPKVDQIVLRG